MASKQQWDHPSGDDEEAAALAALLNESNARDEKFKQDNNKTSLPRDGRVMGGGRNSQRDDFNRGRGKVDYSHRGGRNDPYGGKPVVEDDRGGKRRRRRWNDKDPEGPEPWGERADDTKRVNEEGEKPEKVKAEFGLSGALATDKNTGNVKNGVTLKFSEPAEARIPNTRWRLYVFRKKSPDTKANDSKDDLIDTFHISKQSSYLFGRDHAVADIPVDHPSLSKQHAVLQYRSLPTRSVEIGKPEKLQCKPYLMDLESTNGTFINGVRIDSARYYELRRGDVIGLGASTREYVLLTEQSVKTGI